MADFDDKKMLEFIQHHVKNVLSSLYQWGEPDEIPITLEDSVVDVIEKMSAGVHKNGRPELLSYEHEIMLWALCECLIPDEWPTTKVMLKEIPVHAGGSVKEEQIAEILDVNLWEIKPRMSTEEGVRMCWIGAVVRKLALQYYNEGRDDDGKYLIGMDDLE